jgi:uncharacterized membrane protein
MADTYDRPPSVTAQCAAVEPSLVTPTHVIYALHSLSILIGVLLWVVLAIVLIGFLIGPAILMLTGLWVIYRVVRGWLALRDGRPVGV